MKPKSPLTKKLVGGQHRLPAELKQEILNSPAKMKKKPTGPRAEKKSEMSQFLQSLPPLPGKGEIGQEYLKGGQKGLTGKAAYRYGTAINPSRKEVTRLQKEYEKSKKKSPAKKYKSDAQRKAVHASKAEQSPAKMMKKSPAKKPLVGKQKNLPEELKKKILASPSKMKKESATKLVGTGKRIGPGYADKIKRDREREEAKRKEQSKKMRKIGLKDKIKETTKAKKKTNTVGTGFMQPPYKDTVKGSRPYAKRQGYHGYKNFKSILKK